MGIDTLIDIDDSGEDPEGGSVIGIERDTGADIEADIEEGKAIDIGADIEIDVDAGVDGRAVSVCCRISKRD
jgi:hypothetical protein